MSFHFLFSPTTCQEDGDAVTEDAMQTVDSEETSTKSADVEMRGGGVHEPVPVTQPVAEEETSKKPRTRSDAAAAADSANADAETEMRGEGGVGEPAAEDTSKKRRTRSDAKQNNLDEVKVDAAETEVAKKNDRMRTRGTTRNGATNLADQKKKDAKKKKENEKKKKDAKKKKENEKKKKDAKQNDGVKRRRSTSGANGADREKDDGKAVLKKNFWLDDVMGDSVSEPLINSKKKRKLNQLEELIQSPLLVKSDSRRAHVHQMGSVLYIPPASATAKAKTKLSTRAGFTTRVIDGVKQNFIDVGMATAPHQEQAPMNFDGGEDVVRSLPLREATPKTSTITNVFSPRPKRSKQQPKPIADVHGDIKDPCALLRKLIEQNHTVRDIDMFKNSYITPAASVIIPEVDNVEVVDHILTNSKKSFVMVRTTFPATEDHVLIQKLHQHFDDATYDTMKKVMRGEDDLVLLAFVTLYNRDSSSTGHLHSVEGVSFHSLILMKKPENNRTTTMKVPVMWTSPAYNSATLDRLLQIASLVFWGTDRKLQINSPANFSSSNIDWDRHPETVVSIASRLYGKHPLCEMIPKMEKWSTNAKVKIEQQMTPDMMSKLEEILQPTGASNAEKKLQSLTLPLGFFTHYISQTSTPQRITELGAEILQSVTIKLSSFTNDKQLYIFHCSCCEREMNTPVEFVKLISLGRSIINQHNFGDVDDVNLSCALGPALDENSIDFPKEFMITPCQPDVKQSFEKRRRYFDAMKIDGANDMKSCQSYTCNLYGLTQALLPSEVTAETLLKFPLVDELSKMMVKLLEYGDANQSSGEGGSMNSMQKGRPIQVGTKAIDIDPISKLEQHPSWNEGNPCELLDGEEPFAQLRGDVSTEDCNVGTLVAMEKAISAHTPRDGQGDATLFMLSYYYAKFVVVVEPGMSFKHLKKKVGGKVILPDELRTFMDKSDFTQKFLVVITDCPKKRKKNEPSDPSSDIDRGASKAERLMHIVHNYTRQQLSWYIPTEGLLRLFPKEHIRSLLDGEMQYYEVGTEIREMIQRPIRRSLEYEFKSIRLFSKVPNTVYEVTLTSGTRIYVDAKEMPTDWMKDLQEPWLLEHLTSLCFVSGPLGVYFGIGKKASVPQTRSAVNPVSSSNVWWYDPCNKSNLCVLGAIVNWLHSVGHGIEASRMREWALRQNLSTMTEIQMKRALEYISDHCHIGNVKINFHPHKPRLSLGQTVKMVTDFPAPILLEFGFMSSHQTHSVLVAKKRVYDLQDRGAYDVSEKSFQLKLSQGAMLVSARYLYLLKPKEVCIESCPSKRINPKHIHLPMFGELIQGFGGEETLVRMRRKKKKKKRKFIHYKNEK